MSKVIGVAGCGTMGLSMAHQLVANGLDVWGYDVRPAAEFGDFAPRMVEDRQDFANRCDIVFCMVLKVEQAEDLCFGDGGLFTVDNPPSILVISSTMSPRDLPRLSDRLPAGVGLVDAPVSGSHIAAETGNLTFMVGGADADVDAVRPAFEAMGSSIHHAGPTGAGMVCKVVNNHVILSTMVSVRKGLALAQAHGVSEQSVLDALTAGSGFVWYADNINKIDYGREGYEPVVGNTMAILEKDLKAYIDAFADLPDLDTDKFEEGMMENLLAFKEI
jgi:3-hydroxyisobutyrate dehydrogenase-like beta-hydroxyacid dehydrogenase